MERVQMNEILCGYDNDHHLNQELTNNHLFTSSSKFCVKLSSDYENFLKQKWDTMYAIIYAEESNVKEIHALSNIFEY